MPKSSDKEGPSGDFNSNTPSKLKLFFNRLFKTAGASDSLVSEIDDNLEITSDSSIVADSAMVSNLHHFTEKTVEDVMIPRSDIIAVDMNSTLEELSSSIIEHGHTRTIVYKESLDKIVGFVHIKDLFEVVSEKGKFNFKNILRKHIVSPHSMKLTDLLKQMQLNRTHIAIVVDEYGGTDGLVTIEDIIEEIVGEIEDEHDIDTGDDDYKILKPGLLITSARVEIEELETIIGTKLGTEDNEFDTIGGLIMAKSGSVPEKGEVVNITEDVVAEILESTPRTIKQIKITYIG